MARRLARTGNDMVTLGDTVEFRKAIEAMGLRA